MSGTESLVAEFSGHSQAFSLSCLIKIPNIVNTVTSLLYSEQQGTEKHTIKVIIQYNAQLKENQVRDDWNIETSKDP